MAAKSGPWGLRLLRVGAERKPAGGADGRASCRSYERRGGEAALAAGLRERGRLEDVMLVS